MVDSGGKALEVFMYEKETGEFGVSQGDQDEPGCADQEKEWYAGHKAHFFEYLPASGEEKVEEYDGAGEDDADQPLGEHCQGSEKIEEVVVEALARFILPGSQDKEGRAAERVQVRVMSVKSTLACTRKPVEVPRMSAARSPSRRPKRLRPTR